METSSFFRCPPETLPSSKVATQCCPLSNVHAQERVDAHAAHGALGVPACMIRKRHDSQSVTWPHGRSAHCLGLSKQTRHEWVSSPPSATPAARAAPIAAATLAPALPAPPPTRPAPAPAARRRRAAAAAAVAAERDLGRPYRERWTCSSRAAVKVHRSA